MKTRAFLLGILLLSGCAATYDDGNMYRKAVVKAAEECAPPKKELHRFDNEELVAIAKASSCAEAASWAAFLCYERDPVARSRADGPCLELLATALTAGTTEEAVERALWPTQWQRLSAWSAMQADRVGILCMAVAAIAFGTWLAQRCRD